MSVKPVYLAARVEADHETIVKNTYALASVRMLSYLSQLVSDGHEFPNFDTDDLKATVSRDIDRVLHIYFIKADGNQCDFQLHPRHQGDDGLGVKIRMKVKIQTGARGQVLKSRQAIGYPYWYHRLILLYSKVIRQHPELPDRVLPHFNFVL